MMTRHTSFRTILTMSVLLLASCNSSGGDSGNANRNTSDNASPVITLTGDNPQVIAVGEAYVELGATASDNRDGDLTASIAINASAIDSSVPGTYQVTYDVTDAAGNAAITVTRTVTYEDRTPPVISLVGDDPLVITIGNVYIDPGATASDNVDGDISASITIDASGVDISTLGDYLVTYSVSDAAGNAAATVTRTIRVEDPPLPNAPNLSVEGDIKTLVFSWDDSEKVDFYRLFSVSDGQSQQEGGDIPAGSKTLRMEIAVHLFDFEASQFEMEACNRTGCALSQRISVDHLQEDTIGYFKPIAGTGETHGFGSTMALSGTGKVMVVGGKGGLHVYRSVDGMWIEDALIDVRWGSALALSRSGNVLAVASGGKTVVYTRELNNYVRTAELDVNAWAIDMTPDGRNLAIGRPDYAEFAGAVQLYHLQGGQWREGALLIASNADSGDSFGSSLSLSSDGNVLVVGAPNEQSTASGIGGDQSDNSSYGEGAAYVFENRALGWIQSTYIKSTRGALGQAWATNNDFASTVEMSADGGTLAIGNPGYGFPYNGAVEIYRIESGHWMLDRVFSGRGVCYSDGSGCDHIGAAISLSADGNTLALGCQDCDPSFYDDDTEYEDFGAAYLYSRASGEWQPGSKRDSQIVAPNWRVEQDWCEFSTYWAYCGNDFGKTIALSEDGQTLAVGTNDPSAATGIGGDWNDNSLQGAGSIFIY